MLQKQTPELQGPWSPSPTAVSPQHPPLQSPQPLTKAADVTNRKEKGFSLPPSFSQSHTSALAEPNWQGSSGNALSRLPAPEIQRRMWKGRKEAEEAQAPRGRGEQERGHLEVTFGILTHPTKNQAAVQGVRHSPSLWSLQKNNLAQGRVSSPGLWDK